MNLASAGGVAATREVIFVICIIYRHLARVICVKEYDRSQSILYSICSFQFSLLFHLRVKEFYIFFLDLLERNSIHPLAFRAGSQEFEPLGLPATATDRTAMWKKRVRRRKNSIMMTTLISIRKACMERAKKREVVVGSVALLFF